VATFERRRDSDVDFAVAGRVHGRSVGGPLAGGSKEPIRGWRVDGGCNTIEAITEGRLRMLLAASLLLAAALTTTAQASPLGDTTRPVEPFSVEVCRSRYTPEDFEAMSGVVEVREARERYPASYLFVPADGQPHPGVVWLHGSEGGRWSDTSMCRARYLAAKGFATLFLCYSDCGTEYPTEAMSLVDLHRTYQALTWLKSSTYVQGRRMALTGASRGAEQTLVLATHLAQLARTDPSIVLPEAIIAHAPYGTIVPTFNWRWTFNPRPTEFRWNDAARIHLDCLIDDSAGPYPYTDADGVSHQLRWRYEDAACANKPALNPHECWVADPNGAYTDSDGQRLTFLPDLCSLPAWDPNDVGIPAWTWRGSLDGLAPATDIMLEDYPGSVMISQGTADSTWRFPLAAGYLMEHLTRAGAPFSETQYPHMSEPPAELPTAGPERVLFATFEAEEHVYNRAASFVERSLFVSFLQDRLEGR
jgi:hypothetical protein